MSSGLYMLNYNYEFILYMLWKHIIIASEKGLLKQKKNWIVFQEKPKRSHECEHAKRSQTIIHIHALVTRFIQSTAIEIQA